VDPRSYINPERSAYLNFRKASTCAHKLDCHIIIPTKYRKPIFETELARFTKELIVEKCRSEGWLLLALSVQKDHMHLFIGFPPKHSISDIVKKIKGYTTTMIRKTFPQKFKNKKVWAGGYSVESLGFKNAAQIKAYIERQTEHHQIEDEPKVASTDLKSDRYSRAVETPST
jgi:putative transposase